jgi:AraC-like DNA-binding protein
VAYREFRPPPALADVVACTWERTVPRSGDASQAQRVLPDACVDLVWRDGELIAAGPDTRAALSPLVAGETVVGIRMRPGAAGALLGLPASELRDMRVPLDALWGSRGSDLAGRVADAADPDRRRVLCDALLARRADTLDADPLVLGAMRLLGRPASRVRDLADALAISERQLRRRFETAVGYGPKLADRILRFQRFLAHAPRTDSLARLAFDLGYADQAHLTRECGELSGLPPAQLLATLR